MAAASASWFIGETLLILSERDRAVSLSLSRSDFDVCMFHRSAVQPKVRGSG